MSSEMPSDLFAAIEALKAEHNAVILAHYYQDPDIQDISDFLGDSLALARHAQSTTADVILLCGVHFMAETAKLLNPEKTVLVPDVTAGCSLADSCPADAFAKFKAEHPGHVVVNYVNTTAEIKALSDYICTSSNALDVINAIPESQPIIFGPDINLGRYLVKESGRDMVLWPGACIVHETFQERHVLGLLEEHAGAELVAHPECEPAILGHADFVGSTSAMLRYVAESDSKTFIVATEAGILHAMRKGAPGKTLIPAAPETDDGTCGCSTCPFMKKNTLEKVYLALRDLSPQVDVPVALQADARRPIERMLEISA